MPIRILDEEVINLIAAGEVVERPASIVKELIENSIDAGAGKIVVEVEQGGTKLIRVIDDGCGMGRADAENSVKRHATSKISAKEDLDKIATLGFRGEALSSIASVSRLRIRTGDGKTGTEVRAEGKDIKARDASPEKGTTIEVRDLFFNTPARKKHLATIRTEAARISDIVSAYALLRNNSHIELVIDGNRAIVSPATEDLIENIGSVWGADAAKNMVKVEGACNGAISRVHFQKPSRLMQQLYVNGRAVKSRIISEAVYKGYHTFLNVGMHPAYVLDIRIDTGKTDVNIHPRKEEVRIEGEEEIALAVADAVRKAITVVSPAKPKVSFTEQNQTLENYSFTKDSQESFIAAKPKSGIRIVGQAMKTYILAENKDSLMIIDQHAAQERVRYEKYMQQYRDKAVVSQELVSPLTLELAAGESMTVQEHAEVLEQLGFAVETFGRNTFLLRAVPEIFGRIQGRDVFLSIVDELKTGKTGKLDKSREERIIRKACRSSIKAGDRLDYNSMIDVLDELFRAKEPYTCPHGRPTMLKFTSADFEKMFRRRL